MPYPSQINLESIITTAHTMIERDGADNISLRNLATELGVKAPSLYRYVRNKDALLRAVNEVTARALVNTLLDTTSGNMLLEDRLLKIAHTYRTFAHENPATYELLYTNRLSALRPDEDAMEQSVLPLQALFSEWGNEADSLAALRGAFAFLHGWVMLEIAGQFRRGGDLDAHFEAAFRAYLVGWRK